MVSTYGLERMQSYMLSAKGPCAINLTMVAKASRCSSVLAQQQRHHQQHQQQHMGVHLEAGKAQEEAGADSDLIYKVTVASFNALAHIAHDMHAQDLHRPQLHIARQLLEVSQILHMLQLLHHRWPLQEEEDAFYIRLGVLNLKLEAFGI